jgi:Protein of unknown function (DUF4197)
MQLVSKLQSLPKENYITMKKLFTLSLILISITLGSCDVINQAAGAAGVGTGISNAEAGNGIKEALAQGIAKSVLQLNTADGFFKDAIYKVLLPPDAKKIENTLRSLGFNSMVDKAILQINRGAEDAAGYAKPIFVDAIKSMTLNDAIGLIRNGDTSATHFFREKTTDKLMAAFAPVIKSSLDKTEATKYYSEMVTKYNNLPITFKKVNPDLTGYVTERATNALFNLIAKEEVNIRTNLAARTSDLLKKVFGGAYK